MLDPFVTSTDKVDGGTDRPGAAPRRAQPGAQAYGRRSSPLTMR